MLRLYITMGKISQSNLLKQIALQMNLNFIIHVQKVSSITLVINSALPSL
jgi:hypothetical protein